MPVDEQNQASSEPVNGVPVEEILSDPVRLMLAPSEDREVGDA